MRLTLRLAWRNVLRNKRRTFIAGIALGVGLASLIFSDALVIGMKTAMIRQLTQSFLGEGQIHARGFRELNDIENTVKNLKGVIADLRADSRVAFFSERVKSLAMISSAANNRSIQLLGIDPGQEKNLSKVDEAIVEGSYFRGQSAYDIVIGSKLASDLEVAIGSRVVVTVAEAHGGDLAQELFRVSGIYRFGSREMDAAAAFARLEKAQQMLAIGNSVHEIALDFTDPAIAQNQNNSFWFEYSRDGNEALGWPQLMPQMAATFKLTDVSLYVTGLILFGVVAFGIINTLFMSIYERIFELGVLRAVGTRPLRIGEMVVFEAGFLAIFGIGMGIVLGGIVTGIISRTGIDYRGIEFVGLTIQDYIYPYLRPYQFLFYPFWLLVLTMLTGLYPAFYASRIAPAEAMRRSL